MKIVFPNTFLGRIFTQITPIHPNNVESNAEQHHLHIGDFITLAIQSTIQK